MVLFAFPAWGADAGVLVPLDATEAALLGHPVSQGFPGDQRLGGGQAPGSGWLVRVDQRRLFQTIHGVAARGSGRLLLNVAPGLAFDVAVERTARTLSGHSLSGRVAGVAGSAVTLAVGGKAVMGTVWTPGAAYELVPLEDGVHVFREVDLSAEPLLCEPVRAEGGWGELRPMEQADADGGNMVDVLVLWTPAAREDTGGEEQMRVGIDMAVAWTNDAYERSGAEVRLNLVGAEEVDYVESAGIGIDLNRLYDPSDGSMDEAHERRDALGADLVSLFVANPRGAWGRAGAPGSFSVVATSLLAGGGWSSSNVSRVFAHELGHNMGLSHDRYADFGVGHLPFSFSFGYVNNLAFEPDGTPDDCWGTIMAYPTRCEDTFDRDWFDRVPYFSTPGRRYPDDEGAPLGVPKSSDEVGADGPADAVLALNLYRPLVASFRTGRIDDGDTPETATPVVATSITVATVADKDDIDYFRIELPEAGSLRLASVRIDSTVGVVGLWVTLAAEDGELIAEDNTVGEDRHFLIEAELEAGVYFVKVDAPRAWDFEYALAVTFSPASAADDHGDVAANATAVAVPSSGVGELQTPSDTDYFRFEVAERGVVRVGTTGETDMVGTLTSEDGSITLTDDDGGPSLNFLIAAKLDPGTYYVSVRGFGGNGTGVTGAYSLNISFSPLSTEADDHADFPDAATDLDVGASTGGELEVGLDRDHFRIEVPTGAGPGQLWVEFKGDVYVKGTLLSPDGDVLNERSQGGDYPPYNFVVGTHVAPGTHILRVEGESVSDTGPYQLEVSFAADSRAIPLFLSASHANRWSFARIINRDNRPGVATIHAIDDAGRRHDPVALSLAARQTAHFNSAELEYGSAAKGLSGGVGAGEGDWRLELETDLDIEALAYVRTGGFLAGMNDVVSATPSSRELAPTFQPASDRTQVSKLRLINTGPYLNLGVWIRGVDDLGRRSPKDVYLYLGRFASRTLTAQEMEAGRDDFSAGALGDGAGRWRLRTSSGDPFRAMSLLESSAGHLSNLTGRAAQVGENVSLPLFLSASNDQRRGFVRVINRDRDGGKVAIHAIDDVGTRHGPVTLPLDRGEARHFDSEDLEVGNQETGLSGGLGAGTGDWRLEFAADINIEALAYVRTPDGFLTGVNAVAPVAADGRHEVVFFNPASNEQRVSRLRLVNPADAPARVAISGLDDRGAAPPEGGITLTLPAGAATSITAQQLEAGASHFEGRFGDGSGKWQLFIEADQNIQAMSLMESPTGHLTNLSAGTAVR